MKLTPKEKAVVEELKNSPDFKFDEGLTDEEILAQARFIEDGKGLDVYDSIEAYRAAKKKANKADET